MDLVAGFKFLRERGVLRMLPLRPGRLNPPLSSPALRGAENVVFLARPELDMMDRIADNIRRCQTDPFVCAKSGCLS